MTLALALAAATTAAIALTVAVYLVLSQRASLERLELALEGRAGAELVGRLCIVNTPQPDDQSIRGVIRQVCDGGGLILSAAHYLEADGTALAVGDVYVPTVAWTQLDVSPDTGKPEAR